MKGVLVLAHGSRINATENTLKGICDLVRAEIKDVIIEEAYMEFRDVNIDKGLSSLMEQGVDDIKVVPYFLFEGIHLKEDIPNEIAEFQKKHPQVKITLGNTLGVDQRLAMVLADRIKEIL